MTTKNAAVLAVVIALVAGAIWYLESLKPNRGNAPTEANSVTHNSAGETGDYALKSVKYPRAQELVSPDGYLNTDEGFRLQPLIGKKVILVDFWTYSCINCERTNPYLNAWYAKYEADGLVIVGVHTPEFEFEKVKENVAAAILKFGIRYPVVQDNNFLTWDAYKNRYWPHKYLIDINGLVVYDHIGEGGYEETEKKIQELLKERKEVLGEAGEVPGGFVAPGETIQAGSPETYFGWSRNEFLANGKQRTPGAQSLTVPGSVPVKNQLYLGGAWNFEGEYAENTGAARIIYRYDAKQVFFVASSPNGVKVRVLRDGVPVGGEHGADVDADGYVMIKEARLYKLINEATAGTHTLELEVENPGLEAFTFTFG